MESMSADKYSECGALVPKLRGMQEGHHQPWWRMLAFTRTEVMHSKELTCFGAIVDHSTPMRQMLSC